MAGWSDEHAKRSATSVPPDLVSRGPVTPAEHRRADGYEVPHHVAWTTDGPLVALLDLRSGERKSLNLTGSRAWLLLGAGQSLDATLAQWLEEFPHAPPSFAAETEALVRELCNHGLLAPNPDPAAPSSG
jgi:hypothetical protein